MRREFELILIYVAPLVVIILSLAASIFDLISTDDLIIAVGGLIVAQISFVFHDISGDFSDLLSKFETQSTEVDQALDHLEKGATAEAIDESNFYDRFKIDVRNAEEHVAISYFDNDDPRKKANTKTEEYYNEIEDTTKSLNDVQVRRMIRAIPQLEEWVDHLIETHRGDSNFSLACIPDFEPDADSKGHVAVQLIDNYITYFVAISGQQQQGEVPRDLRLKSNTVRRQWIKYYNRIWGEAFLVMRRGMVREDELEAYRDHIEELKSEA